MKYCLGTGKSRLHLFRALFMIVRSVGALESRHGIGKIWEGRWALGCTIYCCIAGIAQIALAFDDPLLKHENTVADMVIFTQTDMEMYAMLMHDALHVYKACTMTSEGHAFLPKVRGQTSHLPCKFYGRMKLPLNTPRLLCGLVNP